MNVRSILALVTTLALSATVLTATGCSAADGKEVSIKAWDYPTHPRHATGIDSHASE